MVTGHCLLLFERGGFYSNTFFRSWECGGCFLRQEPDTIECPACNAVKPGHEEEVKAKKEAEKPQVKVGAGGFTFAPAAGAAGAVSSSGFTFGAPSSSASSAAKPGGFTFGGIPAATGPDGHLSFDGQGLKLNTEADAKPVADKIAVFKNMKELTFSGNTVGIEAAKALGKALEKHPEFERAHWKDMFTGRMKTEIPPALIHLGAGIMAAGAKLVELDLSDNAFGPIGVDGLKELLKSPSCFTLKELRLNNTGCGVTGGKALAKLLNECYDASKKNGAPLALRVFVLGRSRQENDGAKALAEVFKKMGSLEEVVLPQNGIYHEGIAALSDAFANNPNLRILNMNDNTFTVKGARCLAAVLPKMQKLKVLNLGDCLLKSEGAILISNALRDGHADLEELHMNSNEIRVDGGITIAQAVANKRNLKTLAIDTNEFGEAGCEMVREELENCGRGDLLNENTFEDDEDPDSEEDEEGGDYDDEDGNDGEDGEDEDYEDVDSQECEEEVAKDNKPMASFSFTLPTPKLGGDSSAQPASSGGLFGSLFGKKTESSGLDLSASKAMPSFASVAGATSGFSFGNPGSTSLFGGSPAVNQSSPNKSVHQEEDDGAPENGPDPHFEPIIPLPELVTVTTGEEDEEILFKHRAKVYRFDPDKKEWKDRGVGDIKILKHKTENKFRVLLRREQIHKIACNHYITSEMELKPMFSSDTAVCYFAQDFADEEQKTEHLAVKFKLKETKDDFKAKFEECQRSLKGGDPPAAVAGDDGDKGAGAGSGADGGEAGGNATGTGTSSIFGSTNTPSKNALFGGAPTPSANSIFGGTPQEKKAEGSGVNTPASTTIFGSVSTPSNSSIFGSTSTPPGSSIFGSKSPEKPAEGSGVDLSASKSLASFASVAGNSTTGGFAFGNSTPGGSKFSFAGAGSTLFGGSPSTKQGSPNTSVKQDEDDGPGADDAHDPHFEPIIPLPELVTVTTGEEDEEVVFKHRAKVYRFDPDKKEWKDRGVGDIKILKHKAKNTFRVLLRREQVHKIACNHYITKEMELKPMFSSETAVCYFAMDFADEEAKMEHMAVKFKHKETKDDFKAKFEECQKQLDNPPPGGAAATSGPEENNTDAAEV